MAGLERRPLRAVAALTVFAAALRFATLDVQSFWSDEAVTASLLDQSFGRMVDAIPGSESTPPLYYVLAWVWTRAFGLGEVGLRSLSALAGTATVPAAYLVARRLGTERAALVTAALVAVNPLLWWYAQEARAYALLVLLTTVATAAFVNLLVGRRGWVLWAVASALAVATHYFAAFVVVPQLAWLLWRAQSRRAFGRAPVAACATVVLTGLALVPLVIEQGSGARAAFISESTSVPFRFAQSVKQFLVGYNAPLEVATTVAAITLAALALVILAARAESVERHGAAVVAWLAMAAVGLPLLLAVLGADYVISRNLLPGLVPALALLGIGFGARAAGRSGIVAAGVLAAVSLWATVAVAITAQYQRDNWRGAVDALGPPVRDRAVVVTPADGRAAVEWYMAGARTIDPYGRPVTEMDVIATSSRKPGEPASPPRGPVAVPQGFELARQVDGPGFRAVVHVSAAPINVAYEFAAANRLAPLPTAVLYQDRRASSAAGGP